MDKLSLKILKHIKKSEKGVKKEIIVAKFGSYASESLSDLEKDGFISSGRVPIGCNESGKLVEISNGLYKITPKGISFLEARPGELFDKWTTRIIAIWGAITGTIALALSIVQMFQ